MLKQRVRVQEHLMIYSNSHSYSTSPSYPASTLTQVNNYLQAGQLFPSDHRYLTASATSSAYHYPWDRLLEQAKVVTLTLALLMLIKLKLTLMIVKTHYLKRELTATTASTRWLRQ